MEILNIETLEIAGLESAFKGLRNPMNSWESSDSAKCTLHDCDSCQFCDIDCEDVNFIIGDKDMDLAKRMIKAGNSDSKFLRQIHVWVDMDMPRYFWSEFDTYKFNNKNSCSTMHKLLNTKEQITLDMFVICEEDSDIIIRIINRLESLRIEYQEEKLKLNASQQVLNRLLLRAKRLLPEGFLQLRTVDTNYAELRNMYHQRKPHRLKEEWVDTFCGWVETLPYAKELIIE